uniref:PPPDE domain-containing protein n=1 Tax=Eimeria tenella TaxID=5802 RepID=H9B951_EIMTE|nr:hypothetical protein [Eimeria tenella]
MCVQIGELEYSFGEDSGVMCSEHNPRIDGIHSFLDGTYEYSLHMGACNLSVPELHKVISSLQKSFPGSSYDLIRNNCNHFSDALLKSIVGRGIPPHINRASRYGQWLGCLLPQSSGNTSEHNPKTLSSAPSELFTGVFGGQGHRLGGPQGGGIGEYGIGMVKKLIYMANCFKQEAPSIEDEFGAEGCRSSHSFLSEAAQDRMRRQLSHKRSFC